MMKVKYILIFLILILTSCDSSTDSEEGGSIQDKIEGSWTVDTKRHGSKTMHLEAGKDYLVYDGMEFQGSWYSRMFNGDYEVGDHTDYKLDIDFNESGDEFFGTISYWISINGNYSNDSYNIFGEKN